MPIEDDLAEVKDLAYVCKGGAWCHSDALAAEVERLRDVLNTQDVQHAHERAVHAKANAQAREEVERLRAENAQQRADWATLEAAGNAELDRLRAENARLEKMLNVCSSVHGHNVALKAENAELIAKNEQLYKDRYDALSVHTKEGMLASEWLLRTGKAERRVKELEAENAELRSSIAALSTALRAGCGNGYALEAIDKMLGKPGAGT